MRRVLGLIGQPVVSLPHGAAVAGRGTAPPGNLTSVKIQITLCNILIIRMENCFCESNKSSRQTG
jgi:hypothetical protein